MKALELASHLPLLSHHGLEGVELTGITHNSTEVEPGWLFVALAGEKRDGHRYIGDALSRGAAAVLGSDMGALAEVPAAMVAADARTAMGLAANAIHGWPGRRLPLVGVTGTNGKTTITYMVEAGARGAGLECAVVGTVNARFGGRTRSIGHTTPEAPTLCRLLDEAAAAGAGLGVLEVSSHALSLGRVAGLDFAVGIFTNLSQDHLDFHQTMAHYAAAKESFFTRFLPASSTLKGAVVNVDDPVGRRIADACTFPVLRYSLEGTGAELTVERLAMGLAGSELAIRGPWGRLELHSPFVGRHNVHNLLAALGAIWLCGLDVAAAATAIAGMERVPGRLDPVANPLGMGIWVDYCHTPDALEKVLTALREVVPGRLCVLFGAGGDRDRGKRPEMARVVERFSDVAIVTSDNPRSEPPLAIIDEILSGFSARFRFSSCLVIPDRRLAIAAAVGIGRSGDGLLIGGKGHECYQQVGDQRLDFDDLAVALEEVARVAGGRR